MADKKSRRDFIKDSTLLTGSIIVGGCATQSSANREPNGGPYRDRAAEIQKELYHKNSYEFEVDSNCFSVGYGNQRLPSGKYMYRPAYFGYGYYGRSYQYGKFEPHIEQIPQFTPKSSGR